MLLPPDDRSSRYQRLFHERWQHLHDPHVRVLAWLLDSPDMLDRAAPQWQGRIASLGRDAVQQAAPWLLQLDRQPEALHQWLAVHRFTRLGRYAERLLTWYFREQGNLVAHGVQVRDGSNTVGEFDFLLREQGRLVHWELATKVYLLQPTVTASPALSRSLSGIGADYFVGPNLADTLGAKMSKIMDRQLGLSRHPACRAVLSEPVESAAALIKGWLFYPDAAEVMLPAAGLSADHCRGFWVEAGSLNVLPDERYLLLDRLQWLAPVAVGIEETIAAEQLLSMLRERHVQQPMPVMIARLRLRDGRWFETERGFVVPDDWANRAERTAGISFSPFP